jgi:hypothetical protein
VLCVVGLARCSAVYCLCRLLRVPSASKCVQCKFYITVK